MNFDGQYGALAVFGIAFIITVAEPRVDFPQIARPDRLTAQRTEGLAAGRPAIDHDESHVEHPQCKAQRDRFLAATAVRRREVRATICGRRPVGP
jgi:hypothetical protein